MDSPDRGSPKPNLTEDKKDVVTGIIENDKRAFNEWAADPNNQGKLSLPEPALRYMVISSRILELADDPTQVGLDIAESSASRAWTLVVEHRTSPVTNQEAGKRYLSKKEELRKKRIRQGRQLVLNTPEEDKIVLPSDVDPYHVDKYQKLFESGVFSPNDYFLYNTNLMVPDNNPKALYIGDYRIRDRLQRQGIGTSFYERLRECARQLGFRFLTGQNWENNNITYFRDKLGRVTLDQIKPEKRGEFLEIDIERLLGLATVDFLYPEDKDIYLQ